MAEMDVKRNTDTSRKTGEQASSQGTQAGGAGRPSTQSGAGGQNRGQGGEEMQRSQGREAGRQALASTRGRSGSGLSRETGGWGWPSRSLFSMNPIDLWSVSPFELMRRMSDEMDRMVQAAPTDAATWIPAVEVAQRDGKLVITAELPGLKEEDVRVEATDEGLVIEGERKREHEETSGGAYRSERSYGFFRRVIALPEEAQVEQAQARFTNGVLEVTVPLSEESSRRRRIPISASAGGGQGSQSEQTGGQGGATGSASTSGGSSTSSNEQAGTRTRG